MLAAQAEAFGVPGSGTVDELLADDDIEIVVNLTLPKVHVEVALQVLAAGKNVWSEKPFSLDRESGRKLLDAAHAQGLRVATAPDTFLGAGIQSARRLVENGRHRCAPHGPDAHAVAPARSRGTPTPTSCSRRAPARCSTSARTT